MHRIAWNTVQMNPLVTGIICRRNGDFVNFKRKLHSSSMSRKWMLSYRTPFSWRVNFDSLFDMHKFCSSMHLVLEPLVAIILGKRGSSCWVHFNLLRVNASELEVAWIRMIMKNFCTHRANVTMNSPLACDLRRDNATDLVITKT